MTLEQLLELAGAAAVGYGIFVGWTRSSIKTIKDCTARIEEKLNKFDERLDDHDIQFATLPCKLKECEEAEKDDEKSKCPRKIGFAPEAPLPAPAATDD